MQANMQVSEANKHTIVETLRLIAEIVVWGDQHDGRVFEYFLENELVSMFERILAQRPGPYVNTQLLQSLNIILENISNQPALCVCVCVCVCVVIGIYDCLVVEI